MKTESPITRRKSRQIHVGAVAVGGDAPISVQSMTNTETCDVAATVAQVRAIQDAGADIVIFPELVVTGYPPRDLLFKSQFVNNSMKSINAIAEQIGTVPALIGFVEPNPAEKGRRFFNSAGWCERGKILQVARKCLLPTYDVFDEDRYFEAAEEPTIMTWKGWRLGVTICEDIWTGPIVETSRHYESDPLAVFEGADVDMILNLSASPWHYGKDSTRQAIVRAAALRTAKPIVYVNAVGGNDELVFDGHSMVMSGNGDHEVWSHSRDYGVLVANPLPVDRSENRGKSIVVKPGEEFRLRFGVQVHEHAKRTDYDPAAAYRRYLVGLQEQQ